MYLGQHRAARTEHLLEMHSEELADEIGPFTYRDRSPDDYTDPVVVITTEAGDTYHATVSSHHADATLRIVEVL